MALQTAYLLSAVGGKPVPPGNLIPKWPDPWQDPDEATPEEIERTERAIKIALSDIKRDAKG